MTLLAILAWPLLASLGLGRPARLIGVLALIVLYVPLTGASPSIMRAGAMGVAGTVAALAGRPASRSYALLLSAAFTLVLDPRAWLDSGWQLSFAAVLGIFCLAPGFTRAMSGLPESLAAGTAVTLAATLATAPLMAFQFGRVPLVSLPANLLALPAVAPIMWLGMLAAATGQLWAPAASLLNAIDAYCLAYLTQVARWSARWPGAGSPVRIGSAAGLAFAYAALAATMLALFRLGARIARSRDSAAGAGAATALKAAALLALAAAGLLLAALPNGGNPATPAPFTASFLDVGQGDAILLQPPGGAVLVDAGPPEGDLVAKLREHGVHAIDVVVLTHPQRDHEGGLAHVLRSFPVGTLLDGGSGSHDPDHRRIIALAADSGERVIPARAGQVLTVAGLRLEVLSPPRRFDPEGDDPNRQAVVMLASYRGLDLMLPADAESDVTLALPLRPVEVLKVAHHGSEDEGMAALLYRLRPQVAVIEVGERNPFGHPRAQALRALLASVPRVLRTDRDGEVRVSLGARGMLIQSER